MAVKYVKDFAFDSGFGYTGSAGQTPVRGYNRGGKVFDNSTRNPISKFPELAPAMVGKGPGKMGGKTSDVAPMSKAKANPQIAKYAKGGAVKKPMAKPMKAKMMKKAEGGPVAEITAGDGMSPLQAMPFRPRESGPRMERWSDGTYHFMPEESGQRTPLASLPDYYRRMSEEALAKKPLAPIEPYGGMTAKIDSPLVPHSKRLPAVDVPPTRQDPGLVGLAPAPSPLARAAMPTKADRMAMRADRREMARDIMDRYIAGPRRAMPAPRRAMPVAPRAPMVEPAMIRNPRMPVGGVATFAKGGKVSKGQAKVGKVMGEFKRGELHSGSKQGPLVTNPKQAKAIALSEARKAGAKIPKKAMGGRACG